jgi:hypothetical protein
MNSRNFIAIAYLRMSKLKYLPASRFALAAPKWERGFPHETTWSQKYWRKVAGEAASLP